jgi:hypothetical protein
VNPQEHVANQRHESQHPKSAKCHDGLSLRQLAHVVWMVCELLDGPGNTSEEEEQVQRQEAARHRECVGVLTIGALHTSLPKQGQARARFRL